LMEKTTMPKILLDTSTVSKSETKTKTLNKICHRASQLKFERYRETCFHLKTPFLDILF
jgi:hypothetical protein